jgi:hypothetical protein
MAFQKDHSNHRGVWHYARRREINTERLPPNMVKYAPCPRDKVEKLDAASFFV